MRKKIMELCVSNIDVESLKRVEAILGDRRADEIRKDIERLAGLSYGLERASYHKKQAMLNKLRDNRKGA